MKTAALVIALLIPHIQSYVEEPWQLFIAAIGHIETHGDCNAKSWTGVEGCYQQTRTTQRQICNIKPTLCGYNAKDPKQSTQATITYVKWLSRLFPRYSGCFKRMVIGASYNSGQNHVNRSILKYGIVDWQKGIRKEGRDYIKKLLVAEKIYLHLFLQGKLSC